LRLREPGIRRKARQAKPPASAEGSEKRLKDIWIRLAYMIQQVTAGEFHWQDANFDRDSVLGRELIFLIANNEWIRATSEIIDIDRSDAIETTIEIDIDLSRITHEAFRDRRNQEGRIWLPIVVLPPLQQQRRDYPEPFSTLTVTDAAGSPLMTLPRADVRHQVAAALAEIIVNVAAAWEGRDLGIARDHRLLLAAAIYRLLRGETVPEPVVEDPKKTRLSAQERMRRIDRVRAQVMGLLKPFSSLVADAESQREQPPAEAGQQPAPGNTKQEEAVQDQASRRELAERALQVLSAFTESAIVVVPVERQRSPSVVTLKLPGRALHSVPATWSEVFGPDAKPDALWERSRVWHQSRPIDWVLPRASVHLDMLLPTADADRQIRVNLPEGVSPDPSRRLMRRADLDIRCEQPIPIQQLAAVTSQLTQAESAWPRALHQGLADLAGFKADEAWATLRDHHIGAKNTEPPLDPDVATQKTRIFRDRLSKLGDALREIAIHGNDDQRRRALTDAWSDGNWLTRPMQRRTSTDTISPGVVAARARMIEDPAQRSAPTAARIEVHIAVTDSSYFLAARLSGWINVILIGLVLVLVGITALYDASQESTSAEVLALVLTLFAAIQLGRIERPDRSTLRGLLVPSGNGLIVTSILPAVVMAVAIAFSRWWVWLLAWGVGSIGSQLWMLRRMRRLERKLLDGGFERSDAEQSGQIGLAGPENPAQAGPVVFDTLARPPKAAAHKRAEDDDEDQSRPSLLFYTDRPDYSHSEVLHSNWWRRTTAEAVMLNRPAFGFVVRQHAPAGYASASLNSLLDKAQPDPRPDRERPANVLALQRAGTADQLMNFVIFREEPGTQWTYPKDEITQVDLDSGQLSLTEDATSTISVFLGFRAGVQATVRSHPITRALSFAIEHEMVAREVQLPIPAPIVGYPGLRWARLQFNVRTDQLEKVSAFLLALNALAADVVVGILARPEGLPRSYGDPTAPAPAGPAPGQAPAADPLGYPDLVLAEDLDVVNHHTVSTSPDAVTWRTLAVCADWRIGVEADTLGKLDQHLELVGLTTTILHGKSIMLVLGHRPGGRTSADLNTLKRAVWSEHWETRRYLGTPPPHPLLHVHMRTPDRPGATLEVMRSLREAVKKVLDTQLAPEDEWNVWYGRSVVHDGDTAHVQLTIVVPVDLLETGESPARSWTPAQFADIERRTLTSLANKLADGRHKTSLGDPLQETAPETIVRISPVEVPNPNRDARAADHVPDVGTGPARA
jgi:hypothetical protein